MKVLVILICQVEPGFYHGMNVTAPATPRMEPLQLITPPDATPGAFKLAKDDTWRPLDPSKIKTLEDVILVLSHCGLQVNTRSPGWSVLQRFAVDETSVEPTHQLVSER